MGFNIYQWLWERIGGRPWTYIIRDFYHAFEWCIIIMLILAGVTMGKHLSWLQVWLVLGIFTIGYIGGHLFFGKDWLKGQKGNG